MLLEARDVTKAFGSFKAVDSASVTLEQGDRRVTVVWNANGIWRAAL